MQGQDQDGVQGMWELVTLPAGLPPVEFGTSPKKADSGSPAPGRLCHVGSDKRDRGSSDSSSDQNIPTVARKDREDRQGPFRESY